MARNNKGRRGGNQRILNVRVADSAAGQDGLKVDRQISAVKTSESQMRVAIGDLIDIGIPTTDVSASYGFEFLLGTDDFASLSQQFNLFRIVSIKYEIFDLNPNQAAYNNWGIWHDNYTAPTASLYTRANIVDLPDSRVLSGGTGQTTLYWVAHGTAETQFQSTITSGTTIQKYGGLKYWIGAGTANAKYSVQCHAIVDFRGRR